VQILRDADMQSRVKIALQPQSAVVFYYKCVQFAKGYAAYDADGGMIELHDEKMKRRLYGIMGRPF
jgi:hypothetical protein